MDYNIVSKYITFIKREYLRFFNIIFHSKYQKKICEPFIDTYIGVRYYNETDYLAIKDFIDRINKELVNLTEKLADDDNIDDIKNIVALFGYLIYLDDAAMIEEDVELIKSLVEDDIVKISNKEETLANLIDWYKLFKDSKESFSNVLVTKDFNLLEKRFYKKLHYLELEHNIKISNLYSEYAIDKAYNSGIISEDKLFITYILASSLVLNNAINLDFSRYYMVPMASTLFEKEKKFNRLINIMDNALAKKFISIRITYSDYKANKKKIDELIANGYSFALELDSKYTGITGELVLFPYILAYEDSPEYEMLERDKERLKSKIVKFCR